MTMTWRGSLGRMTAVSALAIAMFGVAIDEPARAAPQSMTTGATAVQALGTVNLAALAAERPDGAAARAQSRIAGNDGPVRNVPRLRPLPQSGSSAAAARSLALPAAVPASVLGRAPADSSRLSGFNGIDHFDQRSTDNGNQFSTEPPDQALAVGNGFVLEGVNNAFSVYDRTGEQLVPPVASNLFFGFASAFVRPKGPFGPSLSDPRAYFDASTGRFFIVEWGQPTDPATGNVLNTSFQMIAVSKTGDATGDYYIFAIDTTNADVAGCPCIPDFQQIGLDANGLFITQNLFGISSRQFAGATLLAMSKRALAHGEAPSVAQTLLPNDFTVHPAVAPPDGDFEESDNGTEYFVESIADLTNDGTANAIRVFAASNTESLRSSTPSLTLTSIDVPSQTYGQPVPATQPNTGPRPLGTSLGEPTPQLDGGDARLSAPPVFIDHRLWAATATVLPGSTTQDGIAFFDIKVQGGARHLAARMENQGILAAPGTDNLIYPAIAMTASLHGAIGVTIVGPSTLPSTAVIPLSRRGAGRTITITGVGQLPDDGFTAYKAFGGSGVGRWGDYGAAAVDEHGRLWLANEYIPNLPRTTLANWGTFITSIGLEDEGDD